MKINKSIIVAAVVLAASLLNSRAQSDSATVTNAPPAVEAIPKYPWNSSLTAGLTLTRGNSHTLMYSGSITTDKKTPENEFSLGANGAYGSQNSVENVNNYGAFGQWNHLFSDRFYGYARATALRDLIADVDYRFNLGPGVGYYFIKGTNTTLAGEGGLGYEYQHLGDDYQSFMTARLAERFEHKFNDRARLWQTVEWLPQVDKVDNYVVNFEIGIETSITKTISFKTYLDDNYQNEPATGRLKNDTELVSALSYKF